MKQAVAKAAAWLAAISQLSKEVWNAFFLLEESESVEESTKKVALTVGKRIFYLVADYWLAALSWSMVITLNALGYAFHLQLLAMWIFDILVAGIFVLIFKKKGLDVTLAVNFRQAVDAVSRKSRLVGKLAVALVIIKAIYWDGPEHVVIFFEKELKTNVRTILVLVALTAVQALIWTTICYLGFESISQLWTFLWSAL